MDKAVVIWNEEQNVWELHLKAAGEADWTFERGWKVKDEDPISGNAWVFDGILCMIAQLQRDGWTVVVRV